MEVEYGSNGNIRFLNPEHVSMVDSEGNVMKCACGEKATAGINGGDAFRVWCSKCYNAENFFSSNFIYKPPESSDCCDNVTYHNNFWIGNI
jgi:hypothetical protein